VPFLSDDDAPWYIRAGIPDADLDGCGPLPEVPAELLEVPHAVDGDDALPPCDCPHCEEPVTRDTDRHVAPDSLANAFAREWTLVQRHTGRAWKAAARMHDHVKAERGAFAAEHVGAHLALITNTHPRTGEALLMTSVRAVRDVPELADLVEAGELGSKHVDALLDEVSRWTETPGQAAAVVQLTLDRCRDRVASQGWPTPGQLRKRLRTAAVLLDLRAAEKRRKSVAERRGVSLLQTGAGAASLVVEGPDLPLLQAYEAIRARAEAMGELPQDSRTHEQRMYDAAVELLSIDADGGDSARPTTGMNGEPLRLVVRGVEINVLVPYSLTQGGRRELAEVHGFGSILPSTARELLNQARSLRRVAVDAVTGEVLAVDDTWKAPRKDDPDDDGPLNDGPGDDGPGDDGHGGGGPDQPPGAPSPVSPPLDAADDDGEDGPPVAPAIRALVQRMARRLVMWQDLSSSHYRVPGRLRRHLQLRDRTCTFPGCSVPGRSCDVDHREEWPRGGTLEANCHCLCRRHHRAKQDYFTVTLDTSTGDTCWTTPDGDTYRRPQPRF
jgi:hypothetical protein